MNTNGIQEAVQAVAVNVPFMGLFWYALKRIEKKDEQIDVMNDKLTKLVENNTNALSTMANTVKEQSEVAKTLNERIYTVLTRLNDK